MLEVPLLLIRVTIIIIIVTIIIIVIAVVVIIILVGSQGKRILLILKKVTTRIGKTHRVIGRGLGPLNLALGRISDTSVLALILV